MSTLDKLPPSSFLPTNASEFLATVRPLRPSPAPSSGVTETGFSEATGSRSGGEPVDQKSGLSLLLRKSSEEEEVEEEGNSEPVRENALTLLDRRRVVCCFVDDEVPAIGRTLGVLADDEEEEVEDGFVRLLLREEDLKAETAMEGGDGELEETQWIMGENSSRFGR